MVEIAAMLVECDQQKRLVPTRAIAKSVVDVVDQLLTQRNVIVRVLAFAP